MITVYLWHAIDIFGWLLKLSLIREFFSPVKRNVFSRRNPNIFFLGDVF